MALDAAEGADLVPTVDLDTAAGYAHLLHAEADVVAADYAALRRLQLSRQLFKLEERAASTEA